MLSPQDNALLTRISPGTPMGHLLRQYWQPALLASELPEPDCSPLRLRLLGEDLVAFRTSTGSIGVLGNHCPHRGASLFFGRNEEAGLRCVYHGWKFEIDGRCVDMPNEPAESNFNPRSAALHGARQKVQHTAYPAIEAGGAIWVYMGDHRPVPPLPGLEWIGVPPEQRYAAKRMQYCNWVQAVEGEIDQSHVSFLHRQLTSVTGRPNVDRIRALDTHPRFSAVDTDYGVLIGAAREAGDGTDYWRITQFLLPFWSMTGPYGENPSRQTRAWVPMDDQHVMVFSVTFHPLRPLEEGEIARMRAGSGAGYVGEANFLPPTSVPGGAWRPKASASSDYFVDRARQKTELYSGIPEF
jgi:phenylpropionate dioxygenase-like ring-hydroxylating dioxygenase large terminal subunit